tara:strand:- start:12281 stop:13474 length:1194 start_codon:yes stop_codon:yes gene_type:complete
MKIKKVIAKVVKDSRGEKTIQIIIKTGFFKRFKTSAPSGKSTGMYEERPYEKTLNEDVQFINHLLDIKKINEILIKYKELDNIDAFLALKEIEEIIKLQIGANSLFAFEASLFKAFADENKKELWDYLSSGNVKKVKIPISVGNTVGGGLHNSGIRNKKPDFQEFLFISNIKTNEFAYELANILLKANNRNDEGAWETDKSNEQVLDVMKEIQLKLRKQGEKVGIGLDIAASSFYKKDRYCYKNKSKVLDKTRQIKYIKKLIKKYEIYYVEDPLSEDDFSGFAQLNNGKQLIVGDDLTTTNPSRFKRAIGMKSINAIIVKPNQIGSLIKVKEVIDLAKQYNIKTIISHRSGETKDDTIADLGVGWNCDFIKTGIYGKVREAKLDRLVEIEKKTKNKK